MRNFNDIVHVYYLTRNVSKQAVNKYCLRRTVNVIFFLSYCVVDFFYCYLKPGFALSSHPVRLVGCAAWVDKAAIKQARPGRQEHRVNPYPGLPATHHIFVWKSLKCSPPRHVQLFNMRINHSRLAEQLALLSFTKNTVTVGLRAERYCFIIQQLARKCSQQFL